MQLESARPMLPTSRYDRYDAAAILLLLGLVVLVLATFDSYAISNDEPLQQRYGELIVAYYTSGFTNRALFEFDNLYLYGGLFDVTATLLARLLPFDVYSIRHILCALIGIGGIAATWGTARLIAGPRAGLIAAVLLTVTGAWYGAMFNHTKDVTFAAAMMGATYALLRAMRDLPHPRLRDVLLFGAMLGAALGLRAVGLLAGFYLGIAILLQLYASGLANNRDRLGFIGHSVVAFIPGLIVGYLIMIAAWPWSALHPFNPVRAMFEFAQFHYDIRDLLAGQVYRMNEMPRWYLPAYLAIRLPLIALGGAALAIFFAGVPRLSPQAVTPSMRHEIAFVAFMVAFPVAVQVIGRGPAFSGMRHFTFVLPPLAVLAGFGLDTLIAALARWRGAVAAAVAVSIAALTANVITLMQLHPHQYLFYNSLVGGLSGAAGRYATDYWVNIMPEAVRALDAFVTRDERESGRSREHYNVAICAQQRQFEHAANDRLHWTDTWEEADFFIAPTHMACDNMLEGKVIATVERQGVVLGVVKDRRAIIRPDAATPPGQNKVQ